MRTDCPDARALADFLDGRMSGKRSRAIEDHLAVCSACRLAAGSAVLSPDPTAPSVPDPAEISGPVLARLSTPGRARRLRLRGPFRAAAASLLLAGLAGVWIWGHRAKVTPAERPAGFLPSESQRFSDGTWVQRLDPAARLETVAGGVETRLHLRLKRGEVRVHVPPGKGLWRLETAAGEVRILGTTFKARSILLPLEEGPVPVAVVEVEEGGVSLHNGLGGGRVGEGHRGILLSGQPPVAQIRSTAFSPELFDKALRELAQAPSQPLSHSAWRAILGFHREAPARLLTRFQDIQNPRERLMAARVIIGLGSQEQRWDLMRTVKSRNDKVLYMMLNAWQESIAANE